VAGTAVVAEAPTRTDVLAMQSIVLAGSATTWDEAIDEAGRLLVDVGAVDPAYVDAMHAREQSISTYVGNGLAIPHGTNESKAAIRRSAVSFVRYPQGLDWKGNDVKFVMGIAGAGGDHLAVLAKIAEVFLDEEKVRELEAAATPDEVVRVLQGVEG
jgi:PTS system mannitol-specific IIC component